MNSLLLKEGSILLKSKTAQISKKQALHLCRNTKMSKSAEGKRVK